MKKVLKGCFGCFGVLFGVLLLLFLGAYVYDKWIWEEWPPERIERITGVRVPKYKIIESDEGERYFNGDYEDRFVIEFKTIPSHELYDKIDSMIANGNKNWHKEGKSYRFSIIWGHDIPAPEGESEAMDRSFSLTITKGEKNGEIRSGAW